MDPSSGSNKILEKNGVMRGLHDFQCCPNIVRVIKLRILGWVVSIACMEKMGNALNIKPDNPKRTVLFGIQRWKDNIKLNLKKHNGKT
jgi:hypothetical protein